MFNIKQLTKIVALAIGTFLILDALATASFLYVDISKSENLSLDTPYFLVASAPLVFAIAGAIIIFNYSKRLSFDESSPQGPAILTAGIKLFGIYLVLQSIPFLFGSGLIMVASEPIVFWSIARSLVLGLVYILLGYLFLRRTGFIVKVIDGKRSV